MLPVSQKWRNAIIEHRTNAVRGSMKASIYIGAFDESATGDASLSTNVGEMYYSDFDNLNSSETQGCSYATWEQDSFRGDGVQYILPKDGEYLRQGWITSEISDSSGAFSVNPVITIEFTEKHSMIGLTLLFDPYHVADSFTITQYSEGTQIKTDSFTGNTDYLWTGVLSVVEADKFVIEFTKSQPYNRIHLQHILFGIGYTYNSDQIIGISLQRDMNPLSLSLPHTTLSFDLFNEDGKFNVDRQDSLVRFLKDDQKVVLTMYFDVGFSTSPTPVWEQLKMCTLWLKSWDVKGSSASFKCSDVIERLNNIQYNDSDYGNTDLNTRLDALMSYAGYSDYEFSETLQPCLVFPKESVAQILQLVSNLTMSSLEQDQNGKLILRPRVEPTVESVTALGTTEAWSTVSSVTNDDNGTYATFEVDFFTGDGSQSFMGSPYIDNGITWTEYPVNGVYSNAVCRIELEDNSTFGSIHLGFPESFSPSSVTITGYRYENGYETIFSKKYNGRTTDISDVFDRVKRIDIRIDGCEKDQRARLKSVKLGWETGYSIIADDIIDRPTGKILTACKNTLVDVGTYTEENGQIAQVDCVGGVDTDISHQDPCTNVTATCESGTVTIIESHAYHTIVRTSEDTKVTLTGDKHTLNTEQAVENVGLHGEDLEIQNPLLTTLPTGYMDWVKAYAEKDTEWNCETLGFPELEAGDLVEYKGEQAQIIKHNLKFDGGACRSSFVLRKE